jgi:hypothetical protein
MPTTSPVVAGVPVYQHVLNKAYVAGTYLVKIGKIDPPLPPGFNGIYLITLTSAANSANTATYWMLNTTDPVSLGSVISGTDQNFAVGDTALITQQLTVPASSIRA